MQKLIMTAIVISALSLGGCASLGNGLVRSTTGAFGGDYRVTLYSGSKAVRGWEVKNSIINEEKGSDGWYFSCRGKLVRLSGDVVVEPLEEAGKSEIQPLLCN